MKKFAIVLLLLTGCAAGTSSGFYAQKADGTRIEIPIDKALPVVNENVNIIIKCLTTAQTLPAVKECVLGKPAATPTPVATPAVKK